MIKQSLIPLGVLSLRSGTIAQLGLIACRQGDAVVPTLLVEPRSLVLFEVDRAVTAYREWVGGLNRSAVEWPKAQSWRDFKVPDLSNLLDLHQWGRRRDGRRVAPREVRSLWSAGGADLEAMYEGLPDAVKARRKALQGLWSRQPWVFSTPAFHPSRFAGLLKDAWPVADLPAFDAAFTILRGSAGTNPFQPRQGRPHQSVVEPDEWLFYEAVASELRAEPIELVRRFVAAGCDGPRDPAGLDETFRRVRQAGLNRVRRESHPQSMLIPINSAADCGQDDEVLLRWLRSDQALRCLEAVAGGDTAAYDLPLAGGDWSGFVAARRQPLWRDIDAPGEPPPERNAGPTPPVGPKAPESEHDAPLDPEAHNRLWESAEPLSVWKRDWCTAAGFAESAHVFWSRWLALSLGARE